MRLTRREVPDEALLVLGAAGMFAAVSFIFGSPIIAALLLLEATALGGARQRVVLLPGLFASGIGALVSTGIGSVSGLSSKDFALGALQLPSFSQPTLADFPWALALAVAVAVVARAILRLGRETERVAASRPLVAATAVGVLIAALATIYGATTDENPVGVLLSGQDQLPALVDRAGTLSLGTLVLLVLCKGLAYGLSLGSFRGGPTFPAIFLGVAAGIMASGLPGLSTTPAVAVCMAAATVSILGLPLASAVLAIVLTAPSGSGAAPLIIVAVVVAHITTLALKGRSAAGERSTTDSLEGADAAARGASGHHPDRMMAAGSPRAAIWT
ncbi:MAG: chloride channel protein [Solirubrobacterales bacterium]|nr:chloride channel protein [Solirubrobacterales bacterium]